MLRSANRAPANVRRLNNSSDVIFYCSVGERSRALALLNAAQITYIVTSLKTEKWRPPKLCRKKEPTIFLLNQKENWAM